MESAFQAERIDGKAFAARLVGGCSRASRSRAGKLIKPGTVVIDVGINRVEEAGKSRITGDVAFAEAGHAAAITPVPGGVGPMTIACHLSNTVTAFRRQNSVDPARVAAEQELIK